MHVKPFTDFLAGITRGNVADHGMSPFSEHDVILAGVVPFCRIGGEWMVYLAKPAAAKPHLPPPKFQIGKGTRMILDGDEWRDCENSDLPIAAENSEPLAVTALREAQEELGLVMANITRFIDAGIQIMYSTTGGNAKPIALYFAELTDPTDFTATDPFRAGTEARGWFNPWKSLDEMRDDHRMLIQHWLPRVIS